MKHTLALSIFLSAASMVSANSNWKMHNTFDEEVTRIVDTDRYTYFIGRTQPYKANVKEYSKNQFSLFRYDKEEDELISLSSDNLLSANVVQCIEYSPEKKMLVVVYSNHDIDLLYDNGKQANIPAYRMADVPAGKDVNSIFIDSSADRVYLSTGFGYVALNDKKQEVAESRNYGVSVAGMSRIGDRLLLLLDKELLEAPVSAPRFNLSEYDKVADVTSAVSISPLSEERSLLIDKTGKPHTLKMVENTGEGLTTKELLSGTLLNVEHNAKGVLVSGNSSIYQFDTDGSYETVPKREEDMKLVAGSHDMNEIWFGTMRKGIKSVRYTPDGDVKWTLTRDFFAPISPAPFKVTYMRSHPELGLLVASHGYDRNFSDTGVGSPTLISGYKDGRWTNYAPSYTNPEGDFIKVMNPNGLGTDPENTDMVYFGSVTMGIDRINLKDGSDRLHLSRTSDPYRDQPGFVEIVPDQTGNPIPTMPGSSSWKSQCMFSPPEFDAYGNMWVAHCDLDDQNPIQSHIFCWETAARKATQDAASYQPMKLMKLPDVQPTNFQILKPLMTSCNKNFLLWSNTSYDDKIVIIDTNGTGGDFSDDKIVHLSTFTDQDGVDFGVHMISCFYEDPTTGNVWVSHREGVFYFNPSDIMAGHNRVTRIKVARNDGTNLADYLLNQVKVNQITSDGRGRKWFATAGAGVVCTSSDGRTIEEELTSSNSPLPDDIVYSIGYVPEHNSIMISTDLGLAEYFMSSDYSSGEDVQVRAYPNPVRPDYFGYVTIDGLPEGSLVKIADSHANLVKELGYISGGEVKWDVTDQSFRRVGSGVYFILSSSDENSGNVSAVGKILVVN